MHAIAAIDVALWDIKGKALPADLALLGGARERCPVYATFGFGFYDTDELPHAAEAWMKRVLAPEDDRRQQRPAAP